MQALTPSAAGHLPESNLPFKGIWIQCDYCDLWCHGECAGLSSLAEADMLSHWTCPPCGRVKGARGTYRSMGAAQRRGHARSDGAHRRAATSERQRFRLSAGDSAGDSLAGLEWRRYSSKDGLANRAVGASLQRSQQAAHSPLACGFHASSSMPAGSPLSPSM